MNKITIANNSDELCQRAADWLLGIATNAMADHGKFHIALAGGTTPRALYQLLASDTYVNKMDWQHVNFYFGDERAVPLDHEQSNFRMAHEAMLDKLAIPATDIFPLITDLEDLDNSARHYEKILRRELPSADDNVPAFDLILLGMGDDGHTASLFPGTTILSEQARLVMPVFVEKLQSWRVSFTYPLINHAQEVAILVTGSNKAEKLKQVLEDNPGSNPIEGIRPVGDLSWFIDTEAAKLLQTDNS